MNIDQWKPYVHEDDFHALADFANATLVGAPYGKLLVLLGSGSNGKSTFVRELTNALNGDCKHIPCTINTNPNVTHSELYSLVTNPVKLIIMSETERNEFHSEAKVNALLNNKFKCREAYSNNIVEGKLKANLLTCVNYLSPYNKYDCLEIIRFTHKF